MTATSVGSPLQRAEAVLERGWVPVYYKAALVVTANWHLHSSNDVRGCELCVVLWPAAALLAKYEAEREVSALRLVS